MGLFDFLKSNKNIITDNGTNYIYDNEGKGNLLYKYQKENGLIDGRLEVFFSNNENHLLKPKDKKLINKVYQEYSFEKGKLNGSFKEFYITGDIKIHLELLKTNNYLDYKNFKLSVSHFYFIHNSIINSKLIFSQVFIEGLLRKYFQNGNLVEENFYKDNKLISSVVYDDDGFINASTLYNLNTERFEKKTWYNNKNLKSEEYYFDKNSLKSNKFYFKNGKLKEKNSSKRIGDINFEIAYWYNTDGIMLNLNEILSKNRHDVDVINSQFFPFNVVISSEIFYKIINDIFFIYKYEYSYNRLDLIIDIGDTYYQRTTYLKPFTGKFNNDVYINGIIDIKLNAFEFYERAKTKYYEQEDYIGALGDYNISIQINPNFSEAFFNRGILKKVLEDYEGALEDYNKAIEFNEDSEAYRYRAGIKSTLKDFVGAMNDYDFAIEKHPNQQWMTYYKRGCLKTELEDYKGAIHDFDNSIYTNINSNKRWPRIDFFKKRGDCKLKIEDYKGAIEDYSKVIQNRQDKYGLDGPSSENAAKILASLYHNRGIARSKINEYKEAIEDLIKALELDPDFEEAIQLLDSLK